MITLLFLDKITLASLADHFLSYTMCYMIIGIYLLDNSNKMVYYLLYAIARIYTVNKYKKYCTDPSQETDWSSVIVMIVYHVSFTEIGRIIFDLSKFNLPRALWSYFTHFAVMVGIIFKDFNPRQIKDLNVMSKFRKAISYHKKFGNFFLDPREYSLNNAPKIIFFMYIYNNTSNCILWLTEIFKGGRYHYKDFARYTIFKILLIFIIKYFMDFAKQYESPFRKMLVLAIFTYLFSLVETEFMREDLILKERFKAAETIDKYTKNLRRTLSNTSLKRKKRGKMENRSKTMTDLGESGKKSEDLSEKVKTE